MRLQHLYEQPPEDWLKQHAQTSWRIGFDSEVMTPDLMTVFSPRASKKVR